MNLDIDTGIKLINKCFESERQVLKEKIWLSLYPAMRHSYGMSNEPILQLQTIDEMFGNNKINANIPENKESIEEILKRTNKIIAMDFEEVR